MRLSTRIGIGRDTLRNRAAGKISAIGSYLHAALLDLALWIEPRLSLNRPLAFRPRPWAGLLVIGVFTCGLVFVSIESVDAIRAVLPAVQHREATP